jgi:mannose/fructose/N-acetylgalactosamine-specific phosphotransferase system component IIC
VSLQTIFIFEPSTTIHLGINVLKKLRFVSLFMFITIKTALEMSVIKTATKDLRKIRTVSVLTLILVATISAFKVFIIRTALEKRSN